MAGTAVATKDAADVELSPGAKLGAVAVVIAVGLVFIAGCWWLVSSAELTLAQYEERSGTFGRSFCIRGTVKSIGYSDFLSVGNGSGEGMKRVRVTDGEETVSVWFDPESFDELPEAGDRVAVTGDFRTILVVGFGGDSERQTLGFASSIEKETTDEDGSPGEGR